MTLVITGSRFGHPNVERWLDEWRARRGHPSKLLHGGAQGVDAQARAWAKARGVVADAFLADWDDGAGAGPERNQAMVNACQLDGGSCLAFPDVHSRGTWDCYLRAERKCLACFFSPAVKWRTCNVSGLMLPKMLSMDETRALLDAYRETWLG